MSLPPLKPAIHTLPAKVRLCLSTGWIRPAGCRGKLRLDHPASASVHANRAGVGTAYLSGRDPFSDG